jgi:Protein of unknown function (DUF2934)
MAGDERSAMAKKKNTADSSAANAPRTQSDMAVMKANGGTRSQPSHDEIAEAAYHRYLNRQGADGSDFDDWLAAEQELESRSNPNSQ